MNIAVRSDLTGSKSPGTSDPAAPAQREPAENDDDLRQFARDVLRGLGAPSKTLPCKYLYDAAGSRIFEQICELDDYYLTRTEAEIFSHYLHEIADTLGEHTSLIEPGAGNCEKAQPLLAAMQRPAAYVPIDISPEILLAAKARIEASLENVPVAAVVGDFTSPEAWQIERKGKRQVIFFPGSTIGNFTPEQALELLQRFSAQLRPGDGLLLGVDLVKDSITLERAYHDDEHVTEAFNKNLLCRINRELGADFDLDAFAHRAFYHPLRQRVEMHLVSLKEQRVRVADSVFTFAEGETIHTENSHKYTRESLAGLLSEAGFTPQQHWTDDNQQYAICYATFQ